jgi:superfamily II DNA/RNA helicase
VASDVAARGVHVDGVELVVHVDPPAEHKVYLHRSGRTARAGSAGDVVTLILPAERRDLMALMRKADIDVTPKQVTADSPAVTELVGDIAPLRHVQDAPRGNGNGSNTGSAPRRTQRRNSPRNDTAPQKQSRGNQSARAGASRARPAGDPAADHTDKRTRTSNGQPARRSKPRGAGHGVAPAGKTGGIAGFSRTGGGARGRRS